MRPLRALFLANDGASAGHVTRALAVARALSREAAARRVDVRPLLVTTSAADALIAWAGVPAVRLPDPARAAGAGWSETERRRIASGVLAGVVDQFAPDLLVADTFPSGPQLEARGLVERVRWRALMRRRVRADRAAAPEVSAGLEDYQLVLVPDDPTPVAQGEDGAPPGARTIPPVTLDEAGRDEPEQARRALALPAGPLALVSCGGGGDREAAAIADALARAVRAHGRYTPVTARGPLGTGPAPVPLAPHLRAFDVALCAAGYNSAHEAAVAGVPLALYARPRAFDDQAARARRFADAGLAVVLEQLDDAGVARALDALPGPPRVAGGGAAVAARALLELIGA